MAVQNRFGVEMDTDRMVAQFMEMVQVDSESGDEARFMAWLRPRLEELGAKRAARRLRQPDREAAGTAKRRSAHPAVVPRRHGQARKGHPARARRRGDPFGRRHDSGRRRQGGHRGDDRGAARGARAAAHRDRHLAAGGSGAARRQAARLQPDRRAARVPPRQRHARHDHHRRPVVLRNRRDGHRQVRPCRHGAREGDQRHPGRVTRDRGAHPRPARSRDDGQRRHHPGRHDSERRAGQLHVRGGVPQPEPRQGPGRGRHDGRNHPTRGRGLRRPGFHPGEQLSARPRSSPTMRGRCGRRSEPWRHWASRRSRP